MSFDKSAFFAALKPKTTDYTVDGFGAVHIAQLSVAEVEAIRNAAKTEDAKKEIGLRFIVLAVLDDDGNRVFSDADLDQLRASSNESIEALATAVLKLNGLLKDEAAPN
jgi:hypothetical protein